MLTHQRNLFRHIELVIASLRHPSISYPIIWCPCGALVTCCCSLFPTSIGRITF
jgi:hypothetical protein